MASSKTSYKVIGMTCDHCVRAIATEVSKVSGVEDVQVDLQTGNVTVTSEGHVDGAAIAAAVEEAGYEVTS